MRAFPSRGLLRPFVKAPCALPGGAGPPARPGPAVSRGTRRVINAGDIDGGEGLPRPRRQLDGSALPKRGGRAMHQPPANAGPRLLLTRCGPGFSTTGDDAVTHQASTRAVPWPLEPDPHGHRGDPFPGTPSLPPSSVEALGGGRRVSRSGLHLPSKRVARLWWRGRRGQTPRHGEAPRPRAGPLPPGSAGHPHAGLAMPARLTPGPFSLWLRRLHLQPVNETRSSSTRGRLPECGGGCGRRRTADPGAATPAPPLCQSPPPTLGTGWKPRTLASFPSSQLGHRRTREPGRGTGGGVLRERGRSGKHPPPRSGRQARCSAGVLSLGPAPAMTTTRGTEDRGLSWVSVEAQGQPHPGSC